MKALEGIYENGKIVGTRYVDINEDAIYFGGKKRKKTSILDKLYKMFTEEEVVEEKADEITKEESIKESANETTEEVVVEEVVESTKEETVKESTNETNEDVIVGEVVESIKEEDVKESADETTDEVVVGEVKPNKSKKAKKKNRKAGEKKDEEPNVIILEEPKDDKVVINEVVRYEPVEVVQGEVVSSKEEPTTTDISNMTNQALLVLMELSKKLDNPPRADKIIYMNGKERAALPLFEDDIIEEEVNQTNDTNEKEEVEERSVIERHFDFSVLDARYPSSIYNIQRLLGWNLMRKLFNDEEFVNMFNTFNGEGLVKYMYDNYKLITDINSLIFDIKKSCYTLISNNRNMNSISGPLLYDLFNNTNNITPGTIAWVIKTQLEARPDLVE